MNTERLNEIDQLNNNLKKSDNYIAVGFAMIYVFIGIAMGVMIIYFTHRDIYHHYNTCQEKTLQETISRLGSEKTWYIKEDKTGKMKLIELSKNQLDSLSK